MKFKIVISDDGSKITLIAQGGTFDEAKVKSAELLKVLEMSGIEFDVISEPEQHRHDDVKVGVHAHGGTVHAH